ncbi:hypothetical protein [Roseicitreum antarcticum]|uniref:hypothetical protein n=1 Tax=Roseicitreum antarcticum TaxID=564137 RepID=UPI001680ECD4|nr:hypothetical protein [Roseicitreum antarcticum]
MKNSVTGAAILALSFVVNPSVSAASDPNPTDWNAVVAEARGQTVFWNAWAGDTRINAFIESVGEDLFDQYGVTLNHVKLADTAGSGSL